jgi:AcrR family transcriptional regulator
MIVCGAVTMQAERPGAGAAQPAGAGAARPTEAGQEAPTVQRLVASARELMWETGGPGFTVSQVVAAANTSLKSFYRCFGSKDELLVAMFAEDARLGSEVLAAMMAARPPSERLRTAVVGLFSLLQGDGRLPYAAALVGEHLRLAQSRPADLATVLQPFVELFETEMRDSAARGEIRGGDVRRDARTVFHLVLSYLHALVWHQVEDDPATLSQELWEFCAAALRPEKPPA